MIDLRADGDAIILPAKIVPGASRTRYLGEWEGRARIAVAAAPEKGKANLAVTEFVAKQLNVKRSAVDIIAGHVSPSKTIRIEGVTAAQVWAAFGAKDP